MALLSEIHILSIFKLEWIDYSIIKLYKIFDCSIARRQVVQQFVNPLIVIAFRTHSVALRFEDNFRFVTTTELPL